LADGDPLPDNETWLRVITDRNFVGDDGVIHDNAFGRGAIAAPPGVRAWSHEVSGRRRSLCQNVAAEAQAFVDRRRQNFTQKTRNPPPSAWVLRAVVHSTASHLRSTITPGRITSDVIHTPIDPPNAHPDPAHSDFVAYGSTNDDLDEIRTWLQTRLKVCWPADLPQLGAVSQPDKPPTPPATDASAGEGVYTVSPGITKA
jgi:hypothetical protein